MLVIYEVLSRLAEVFKPDALIVSGFDSHVLDPMSTLRVSGNVFATFGSFIAEIIRQNRVKGAVIVLEGGYGNALPAGLRSFLEGFSRGAAEERSVTPAEGVFWVRDVVSVLERYWRIELLK